MDKPLYEVVRDYEVYMTKKVNSCHERIGQLEEEKAQLNELYVQAKERTQDWAEKHGRLSVELERAKAELMRLTNSITYTQLMSEIESLRLQLALMNAQREAEKETRLALEMEITRLYKKVQGLENR